MVLQDTLRINNYRGVKLDCSPGEVIYLMHNKKVRGLFKDILLLDNATVHGTFLGKPISEVTTANKKAAYRSQIAYVSEQLYLNHEWSVTENIRLYQSALDEGVTDQPSVDRYMKLTDIQPSTRVSTMSNNDLFYLRFMIGLLKKPTLLLIEDPSVQYTVAAFTPMMELIRSESLDRGLSTIISLTNEHILESYPGRVISF